MNISEEKRYVYEMMKDITNERRLLSEMYMELKKRLSELNSLEERGFTDLDVEGFLDYSKNKSSDLLKNNMQRELTRIEEVRGRSVTHVEEKLVPVEAKDVQSLKDYDDRTNKKDQRVDNIKVIDFIASYMRRTNKKMKSADMYKLVLKELEIDLKPATLGNIIHRIKDRHPDVVRIKFGVYGVKKVHKKKDDSTYSETKETHSEGKMEQLKDTLDSSLGDAWGVPDKSALNEDILEQQNLLEEEDQEKGNDEKEE